MCIGTPKTTVTPKSISVAVGDQAELDCMVEGWPDPRVTWTRSLGGGLPLTATVTKEKGKDVWTLRVASVSVLYYGEYMCTAESMLGRDSASGTIESEWCVRVCVPSLCVLFMYACTYAW